MSEHEVIPEIILQTRQAASGIPGEQVEPRQTLPTEDMEPNPANSIPLPPNRQRLVDDIIALYSCGATVERVARYAPGECFVFSYRRVVAGILWGEAAGQEKKRLGWSGFVSSHLEFKPSLAAARGLQCCRVPTSIRCPAFSPLYSHFTILDFINRRLSHL